MRSPAGALVPGLGRLPSPAREAIGSTMGYGVNVLTGQEPLSLSGLISAGTLPLMAEGGPRLPAGLAGNLIEPAERASVLRQAIEMLGNQLSQQGMQHVIQGSEAEAGESVTPEDLARAAAEGAMPVEDLNQLLSAQLTPEPGGLQGGAAQAFAQLLLSPEGRAALQRMKDASGGIDPSKVLQLARAHRGRMAPGLPPRTP